MTVGSVVWGQVATIYGIPAALLGAAMVGIAGLVVSRSFKLQQNFSQNLDPSMHWPEPVLEKQTDPDRGPVMITVEYHIDSKDEADFLNLLYQLADARRRDGAYAWGLFENAANPECFLEYFLEVSWQEHLRHHQRVTEQDRILQEQIQKLHLGTTPPKVTHFLTPGLDNKKSSRINMDERVLK